MLNSLSSSFNSFKSNPVQFILATGIWVALNTITLFAMSGILLIAFLVLSVLDLTSSVPLVGSIAGVLLVVFLYLASGLTGSLIKAYQTAGKKSKVSITEFFSYAKSNGLTFFGISVLKILLLLILLSPLIAINYFYLAKNPIKYADIALALIGLFDVFLVELIFYPAYISAAVCSTGVIKSLMMSFSFLRRKHVNAIGLFVLMFILISIHILLIAIPIINPFPSVNLIFMILPFLNLVPLLLLFQLIYFAMISMFQSSLSIK